MDISDENVVPSSSDQQVNEAQPKKHLTRLQRSKLEALQAFGNCTFDDLSVKKISLQDKLKKDDDNDPNIKRKVHLTQLQKAKVEALFVFKNVPLEDLVPKKSTKRSSKEAFSPDDQQEQKRQRRVETTNKSLAQNKSSLRGQRNATERAKRGREKRSAPLRSSSRLGSGASPELSFKPVKCNLVSPCVNKKEVEERFADSLEKFDKHNIVFGSSNKIKTATETQNVTDEKMRTSSETPNQCPGPLDVNMEFNDDAGFVDDLSTGATDKEEQESEQPAKKLSRLEAAKLEALQSFGGKGFNDIVKTSVKVVAKCFATNNIKKGKGTVEQNANESLEDKEDEMVVVRSEKLPSNSSDSGISEDGDSIEAVLEKSKHIIEEACTLETP